MTLTSSAIAVLLAACATPAASEVKPPADVAADSLRHGQYSFRYVGTDRRHESVISVEGWVFQAADSGEFKLYESKAALDAQRIGHCLSGSSENSALSTRLHKAIGKKVRIIGTYAPTGIDDGSGSMSAIHNFCMGDLEIHARRFEVLSEVTAEMNK